MPIPAPLDEALGLVAPDEHGLDYIFPTVLCGFVRVKNDNPIHHDWLAQFPIAAIWRVVVVVAVLVMHLQQLQIGPIKGASTASTDPGKQF